MPHTQHYTPRAPLLALGAKLQQLHFLKTLTEGVTIAQKKVRHTSSEKLLDALIAILAGGQGLCELNTRVRPDRALQKAFGRTCCADQSLVQATLNAATSQHVAQLMNTLNQLFQQHSLASRHHFKTQMLLLDLDFTGLPCGKTYEYAEKGYQGEVGIRYGRQLGRVIAAAYEEIVVDRLYPGTVYLTKALRHLIEEAETTLQLTPAQRQGTILRMDAGGGALEETNWLLERGYQLHGKDISAARAETYATTVKHWVNDPRHPQRQMGWATVDRGEYVRPVKRLVLRWPPMKEGKRKQRPFHYACLLTTLAPEEVIRQLQLAHHTLKNEDAVTLAYSALYDKRGGTIEIEIKESKQGIGLNKRSKKRFVAQQMVTLLGSLAHNILVWARRWLVKEQTRFTQFGLKRIIRDLFQLSGLAEFDDSGQLRRLTFNEHAPRAQQLAQAFNALVQEVEIKIGAT